MSTPAFPLSRNAAIASAVERARKYFFSVATRLTSIARRLHHVEHRFGIHWQLVRANADSFMQSRRDGCRNGDEARLGNPLGAEGTGLVIVVDKDSADGRRRILDAGKQIIPHTGV